MAGSLDTYKYELKVNGIVVYRGVTNDLERRKSEHRTRWPDGIITKIGRRTTRAGALEWLREQEAKDDLPVES